jgi:hypothetical protein
MRRGHAPIAAGIVLLALLIGQIAHGEAASPQTDPSLAVVSEDPYTNPGTYHRTQVEPDTYAFGSTIVSVFQSGRSTNWGASNFGWSVSSDAGAIWTDGFLPGTTKHATPPGRWQRVTDSAVTYDAKHDAWLIIGVGTRPCSFSLECAGSQVFVSRSTDGAQTFEDPIIPKRAGRSQFHDVPWVTCDNFTGSPYYGNCYSVWADDAHRALMSAYTSSDGGRTWTKATIAPKHHDLGHPIPVVRPDGTIVVLFHGPDGRQSFVSTDGGARYSGPYDLPQGNERWMADGLRSDGVLVISPDVDAEGTVYAAFADCTLRSAERPCSHNDITISTSDDGRHWSDMRRVPIDPVTSSVDHFFPTIAVDPSTSGASAHIGLVYYFYPEQQCDVTTCRLNVGFVSSTDGGSTWTAPLLLAGPFENTWFPQTDSGYMVGEYLGISFVDGKAIPVFPVATEGRCKLGDVDSCNVWIASATIPVGP